MRRLIAWLAGLAGVAALVELLRRRSQPAAPSPGSRQADDPAEELRRRLAEARATAATAEQAPAAAVTEDLSGEPERADGPGPEPVGPSIEERRADVHARAQAAIESMREDVE